MDVLCLSGLPCGFLPVRTENAAYWKTTARDREAKDIESAKPCAGFSDSLPARQKGKRISEKEMVCSLFSKQPKGICAAEGDLSLLPGNRVSEMEIVGIGNHLPDEASCGYEAVYEPETRTMRLTLDVKPGESASIRWNRYPVPEELSVDKKLLDLLLPVRMANMDKDRMLETAKTIKDPVRRMASWMTCDLPEGLPGALAEMEAIR